MADQYGKNPAVCNHIMVSKGHGQNPVTKKPMLSLGKAGWCFSRIIIVVMCFSNKEKFFFPPWGVRSGWERVAP